MYELFPFDAPRKSIVSTPQSTDTGNQPLDEVSASIIRRKIDRKLLPLMMLRRFR